MKLNGIQCDGYTVSGKGVAEFSLSSTTVVDAAALDGQDLKLTQDDGETLVASFAGYAVMAVYVSGDSIRLRAARELEPAARQAIEAIEDNMGVLSGKVDSATASAEQASADVQAYMDALLGTEGTEA